MSARLLALAVLHATIEDIERAHLLPDLRRALAASSTSRARRALERQYAEIVRDVHAAIEFVRSDTLDYWCVLADIDPARFRRRARLIARESLRHLRSDAQTTTSDHRGGASGAAECAAGNAAHQAT